MTGKSSYNVTQDGFRFYNDGTESGATALQNEDINHAATMGSGNVLLQVRIGIQETGAVAGSGSTFQLQYNRNSTSYTNVTGATSYVQASAGAVTDDEVTTSRLTGFSGTFTSGRVDEADGNTTTGVSIVASGYTEILYSILLIDADLNNGDTLDFQVLDTGDSTVTYNSVPRITISKATVSSATGSASGSGTAAGVGRGINGAAASSSVRSITYDTSSSGSSVSSSTESHSHTIGSGKDRILLVYVQSEDDNSTDIDITGVTYNSVSMTELPSSEVTVDNGSLYNRSTWFYMLESNLPSTGSYTIQATAAGTVLGLLVGAISLSNVHQAVPTNVATNSNAAASSISQSVTNPVENGWTITGLSSGDAHTSDSEFAGYDASQTERVDAAERTSAFMQIAITTDTTGPSSHTQQGTFYRLGSPFVHRLAISSHVVWPIAYVLAYGTDGAPTYTEAVGSSTGTSTVTGDGQAIKPATASSSGTGTATGDSASVIPSTASSAGSGAATGVSKIVSPTVASSSGTGTATADAEYYASVSGSSTGSGAATGVGANAAGGFTEAVASASGTGTATGDAEAIHSVVFSSSGAGTVLGDGVSLFASVFSSSGVGTALAVGADISVGETTPIPRGMLSARHVRRRMRGR